MISNFEIKDNYAVVFRKRHIDLHNNFKFDCFIYETAKQQFTMKWIRSMGDWVKEDEIAWLTLIHYHVSYLRLNEMDDQSQLGDFCLGELTFFPSSQREINTDLLLQANPDSNDDILYYFENGQYIRICCEIIELQCG